MTHERHAAVFGPDPWLSTGRHQLFSRLLIGIERYTDPVAVGEVLRAAGADALITTIDVQQRHSSVPLLALHDQLDLGRYVWMGTTSFAGSPGEAVATARALRSSLGIDLLKLDVRDGRQRPDTEGTLVAARVLLAEGFAVLPFIEPDVDVALALQDLGCSAIRLMAAPVASFRGIVDPAAIAKCIGSLDVPAVVEGGLGSPADITRALELGASAVLVNAMVVEATDPAAMARAAWYGLLSGGLATAARRAPRAGPAGYRPRAPAGEATR